MASDPYSDVFEGGILYVDKPGIYQANFVLERAGGVIDSAGTFSVFTGQFSGPGSLTFINTGVGGALALTGVSSYTGKTVIDRNARVYVNGSIGSSSALDIESGGLVGGVGRLPTTVVKAGGELSPGNSIGTIQVGGLALQGGSIRAEIQGPSNDRVDILGGTTSLAGEIGLVAYGGGMPWPEFNYVILSSHGPQAFVDEGRLVLRPIGVSSALLDYGSRLVPVLNDDSSSLSVQWIPSKGAGVTASAMKSLGQADFNQLSVSGAFDNVFRSLAVNASGDANSAGNPIARTGFTTGQAQAAGVTPSFLLATSRLLGLSSASDLIAAIRSFSPEPYAAFQSVGLNTLKQQRELLMDHAGSCHDTGWVVSASKSDNQSRSRGSLCVFAKGANSTSSVRGDAGLSSYDSSLFAGYYGLEYQLSPRWTIGAAYGYGTSSLSNFSLGSASIDAVVNSASLYGVRRISDLWTLRGLVGFSDFDLTASRDVAFGGKGKAAHASPSAYGYTAAFSADYLIGLTKPSAVTQVLLKPRLGVAWGSYQQRGFSERGVGPLNLNVQGHTANSLIGTLGVELATSPIPLNPDRTVTVKPRLAVAYQVDALANDADQRSLTASFPAAPVAGSFLAQGQNMGVNALLIDGGVDIGLGRDVALYADVGFQASSNASQFTYGGGLKISF